MPFRLLIDADVIDTLMRLPVTRRRQYLEFFRRIQEFPANYSELQETDDTGRMLDVCVFYGTEIRYWIDDADRHVKILRLTENE